MSDKGKMSSLQKQLRKKARKPFKTCYNCYEVQEGKIEGEVPDSCNDCKNFEDMIKIEDVLEVVKQHQEELQKLTQDVRELSENPNIYCNNCKDRSAENVVTMILKRLVALQNKP